MEREIVLSSEEISAVCSSIAAKLDDRFSKENIKTPVFIGVLKGSLNFMMELLKYIKTDCFTDYIQVSSYKGTSSTGVVELKKDISLNIKNKTVVIVEDVIDTGITMHYLVDFIKKNYQPKEVIIVSMFDKLYLRQTDLHVDYTGKVLTENKFLVGFGLDYNEFERNVPYVYVATKADISRWDKLSKENK